MREITRDVAVIGGGVAGLVTARRLVEAKTTIPHFYLTMDCRIDKLLALRADINAAACVSNACTRS